MSVPAIGAVAPDLSLGDLGGDERSLATLLGQGPVAVFFFKSGCGASELAAPAVERLWTGYGEHVSAEETGLLVLGVSQDDAATSESFGRQFKLSFPIALDSDLAASRAYDLEVTPTLFLLRGAERLRADASGVPAADAYRVIDVVEGWSREAYGLLSGEIAARIGALPVELPRIEAAIEFRPG